MGVSCEQAKQKCTYAFITWQLGKYKITQKYITLKGEIPQRFVFCFCSEIMFMKQC